MSVHDSFDDFDSEEYSTEDFELLNLRKQLELDLIKKFDKTEIDNLTECWYLIDACWLNSWVAFVTTSDAAPPGKLSRSVNSVNRKRNDSTNF